MYDTRRVSFQRQTRNYIFHERRVKETTVLSKINWNWVIFILIYAFSCENFYRILNNYEKKKNIITSNSVGHQKRGLSSGTMMRKRYK